MLPRPQWVTLLPTEVVALLRMPSAAREAWDELLEVVQSSGASQAQATRHGEESGICGWSAVELRSPEQMWLSGRQVRVPLGRWKLGEGEGVAGLGW